MFPCSRSVSDPRLIQQLLVSARQSGRASRIWLLVALLLTGSAVHAPAQFVTSAADSGPGSLRQVLADIAPGGRVFLGPEVALRPIVLASPLVVNKDVTIDGTGAPGAVIDGNNQVRVFDIGASGASCGIYVQLAGLRIARGALPGGGNGANVWSCATNLTIRSTVIQDGKTTGATQGGGVYQSQVNC
jgi:hypothetical protein